MDHEDQPLLPLDERFRQAEQYSLDLEPPKQQPPSQAEAYICIGNCKICQHCDGN